VGYNFDQLFSFLILSSSTLAGLSFGSYGTSLPSNACFRFSSISFLALPSPEFDDGLVK